MNLICPAGTCIFNKELVCTLIENVLDQVDESGRVYCTKIEFDEEKEKQRKDGLKWLNS